MINLDEKIESKSIKNHTMFFTAGIVLLTLVINAPTTGLLIKKLKLVKESELSRAMLRKVLDEHNDYAEEYISKWRAERSEHGDRAGNILYDEVLDLAQLKRNKEEMLGHLYLQKINKYCKREDLKRSASQISRDVQ